MPVPKHFPRVPCIVELSDAPEPALALVRLTRAIEDLRPVLLHSSGGAPSRWSVLGFWPVEVVQWHGDKADVWLRLQALMQGLANAPVFEAGHALPEPFHGGFLGALSYDLHAPAARLAIDPQLPADDADAPLVVGGVYDTFLVWNHASGACHLVGPEGRDLSAVQTALASSIEPLAPPTGLTFVREASSALHAENVRAAQAAILAGEIYQANISHRLSGTLDAQAWPPADAFAALCAANPVPYAGFIEWDGGALLSASPELLVELEARPAASDSSAQPTLRRARTRPIKGTAPRGSTPHADEALGAALLASAKDNAELAMIVDLERNDLGRVAAMFEDRSPSVFVHAPRRLEKYASVQHLVADVECVVRPNCTELELLGAVFPGGSITGAPKLRSMEVIAELEGRARSFFTGSLGFVDGRGASAFNILIRTLLWNTRTGAASLRVGGGVTWASDPMDEDQETLHKAASLLAGLGIALVALD
jgi:para-aminobenzoate synthetase component I